MIRSIQIVKVDIAPMLQMANEVEKRTKERQQSLKAAFSLLITREQNWIDGATMIALFHAMSSYRLVTQVIADSSFILFCQNVFFELQCVSAYKDLEVYGKLGK